MLPVLQIILFPFWSFLPTQKAKCNSGFNGFIYWKCTSKFQIKLCSQIKTFRSKSTLMSSPTSECTQCSNTNCLIKGNNLSKYFCYKLLLLTTWLENALKKVKLACLPKWPLSDRLLCKLNNYMVNMIKTNEANHSHRVSNAFIVYENDLGYSYIKAQRFAWSQVRKRNKDL